MSIKLVRSAKLWSPPAQRATVNAGRRGGVNGVDAAAPTSFPTLSNYPRDIHEQAPRNAHRRCLRRDVDFGPRANSGARDYHAARDLVGLDEVRFDEARVDQEGDEEGEEGRQEEGRGRQGRPDDQEQHQLGQLGGQGRARDRRCRYHGRRARDARHARGRLDEGGRKGEEVRFASPPSERQGLAALPFRFPRPPWADLSSSLETSSAMTRTPHACRLSGCDAARNRPSQARNLQPVSSLPWKTIRPSYLRRAGPPCFG